MNLFGGAAINILFFEEISEVFVSNIVPLLDCITFEPGEMIYKLNDFAGEMYFLHSGKVNLIYSPFFITVKTMLSGSTFGEMELLDHEPRIMTASVGEEPVVALCLKASSLRILESIVPEAIFQLRKISNDKKEKYQEILSEVDEWTNKVLNTRVD